jgi:hypothetical protein
VGRIAGLDLQRHVADAEALLQVAPGASQQAVVERGPDERWTVIATSVVLIAQMCRSCTP